MGTLQAMQSRACISFFELLMRKLRINNTTTRGRMNKWINVKDKLPDFGQKVKVKVGDLTPLMMGLERNLPPGEYFSVYRKKPSIYCCNDPRHKKYHEKLHWSNEAGYHCMYWRKNEVGR